MSEDSKDFSNWTLVYRGGRVEKAYQPAEQPTKQQQQKQEKTGEDDTAV